MGFAEDLKVLYTGGLVTADSIFLGQKAKLPGDEGPYTTIVETSGFPPDYVQGQDSPAYRYPTAQIVVRAARRTDASARAGLHFNATSIWNRVVNGVLYRYIRPTQEPWDFGLDDTGRIVYVFNVRGDKSPT